MGFIIEETEMFVSNQSRGNVRGTQNDLKLKTEKGSGGLRKSAL